jgi:predicted RNA-binding Zn-ribbon protein involved in translation (DUF1610 family)
MAVDLRSEIFRLRADGFSFGKIAEQLGTNKSRVQRELSKTAREVEPGGNGASDYVSEPPIMRGHTDDPEVAQARKAFQLEQLETQRAIERARRIEAERRVQLMEHPDGAGNGNALAAIVLQELQRMREEQRATKISSPPPPAPSLTDQLQQFRQMADTVQSFAPPRAPSTAVDLEFKVAMERLNLEERRLATQQEADAAERRERMASEFRRNEAVAKAIEEFAPVASAAIQHWFEEKAQAAAPPPPVVLPAPEQNGAPAKPVVLQPEEVVGQCPRCGAQLAISGEGDFPCPGCGQPVVAVEGRLRARLPNGDLTPLYSN